MRNILAACDNTWQNKKCNTSRKVSWHQNAHAKLPHQNAA